MLLKFILKVINIAS